MSHPHVHILSGRALHSGVHATVRIAMRPDDGIGPRVSFPGFARPLALEDLGRLARDARRATVLTDPDTGASIRTPEHLLAALWTFMRAPVDIACDHPEIPGLDGSARPWFTALAATIPPEHAAPPREEDAPGWEYDGREGFLRAEPAERFSVHYVVERGDFRQEHALERAADAPAGILPARTFIFHADWQALTAATAARDDASVDGHVFLRGADPDSGLLLAENADEFARARAVLPRAAGIAYPLLHPAEFRCDNEAARHKILDLLGDLALHGRALPRLRITVRNGGHALHHLFLNHLEATAP